MSLKDFILATVRREPYPTFEIWHETQVLRRLGNPDMPITTTELDNVLSQMADEHTIVLKKGSWHPTSPAPTHKQKELF